MFTSLMVAVVASLPIELRGRRFDPRPRLITEHKLQLCASEDYMYILY